MIDLSRIAEQDWTEARRRADILLKSTLTIR
jgi:hypothetical protein